MISKVAPPGTALPEWKMQRLDGSDTYDANLRAPHTWPTPRDGRSCPRGGGARAAPPGEALPGTGDTDCDRYLSHW